MSRWVYTAGIPGGKVPENLNPKMPFEAEIFIGDAYSFLENPSFLVRAASMVGKPAEIFIRKLPSKQQKVITRSAESALKKALVLVTKTLPEDLGEKTFHTTYRRTKRLGLKHTIASFGSGTVGGLLGLPALPIELPITTAIMLRSIAAHARKFGFDLNDPQVQMECMYVLSLGSSKSEKDDAMNSSYWASRVAFSKLIKDAAGFVAGKTTAEILQQLEKQAAPTLVRLMARVAAQFEIVVSEKTMAQAIPLLGAVGGGAVNALFTDYFSDAARFHFGLKALEREFGASEVKRIYKKQQMKVAKIS
jgi:hypothetical protein